MKKHEWTDLLDVGESIHEVNEYFFEHELTDGMPVVPPTPELVEEAMAYSGYDPDYVVGEVAPYWGKATVAKVAANAVMAGCEPKHLPAVIAGVEAVTDAEWEMYGVQATTSPGGPFLFINGPARDYLGMNYGSGCFGPGVRANATIGRAIRLIMMNLGGARPGGLDLATQGWPGKYTMCIAENEEANPWEPFHVEHGWSPEQNTVTAVYAFCNVGIYDAESKSGAGLMTTLIGSVKVMGSNNFVHGGKGQIDVILSPEWAAMLFRDGYTKESMRNQIWDEATIPISSFSKDVVDDFLQKRATVEDGLVRITKEPKDIHFVVSGGAGKHIIVVFGNRTAVITREMKFADDVVAS